MPTKKRPTQSDVARLAGVTQATVSFVLSDSNVISVPRETRQRILDAVETLGYRPNAQARGLVSGSTSLIAVTLPSISDFFSDVVHGIEDVARNNGYSVIIFTTNDDPRQELTNLEVFASRQVDGTIICGSRQGVDSLNRPTQDHRLAVLTSKTPVSAGVVKIPGEAGLYEVTSHMIALGHTANYADGDHTVHSRIYRKLERLLMAFDCDANAAEFYASSSHGFDSGADV